MTKKKTEYIRCPKCDLNLIDKEEGICDVCKAQSDLNSKDDIKDLCPVCGVNYIDKEEDICKECIEEGATLEDMDNFSDDWDKYVDDDVEDEDEEDLEDHDDDYDSIVDLDDD